MSRPTRREPGVACPHCGTLESKVIDSRGSIAGQARRRECRKGHRFATIESALLTPRGRLVDVVRLEGERFVRRITEKIKETGT